MKDRLSSKVVQRVGEVELHDLRSSECVEQTTLYDTKESIAQMIIGVDTHYSHTRRRYLRSPSWLSLSRFTKLWLHDHFLAQPT